MEHEIEKRENAEVRTGETSAPVAAVVKPDRAGSSQTKERTRRRFRELLDDRNRLRQENASLVWRIAELEGKSRESAAAKGQARPEVARESNDEVLADVARWYSTAKRQHFAGTGRSN